MTTPSQASGNVACPSTAALENGLDPGVYYWVRGGFVLAGNGRDQEQSVAAGRRLTERCAVQWQRICVYPERLGNLALSHVKPG
ncbi:hypothetical protein AXF42_Ash008529 [Apostasia shenzhenica]|nr:hypothetical protein AXF42_Ash008529 [Apostasia shenzhenica]